MRIARWALLVFLLTASAAYAELYEWTDKEGVVHITDDMGKVPEDIRPYVKKHKVSPTVEGEEAPSAPSVTAPSSANHAPEMYGDHPLEWWLNTFRKLREEMQSLQASIASKEQFVSLFESGRRFGQVYSKEDVQRYETLKKEIPADQGRLKGLQDELDELTRKATLAGVPKDIREGR
ncbi:MAG TPA: DUF4124 domain-containing protein [Thermodesulfobacteriota bacterium]|nr:DUF4124 domain-containing protein [Thermodesulfobacteriota bacterium]